MQLLRTSLWSLTIIGLIILLMGWYAGIFEQPEIRQSYVEPFNVVYRSYSGDPNGLENVTNGLISDLNLYGISVYRSILIVKNEKNSTRIQAVVACVIAKEYDKIIPKIEAEFPLARINPGYCMMGSMLYENWMNVYAADWRIRPILEGLAEKIKLYQYSILEIKDSFNNEITYLLVENSQLPNEVIPGAK